MIARTKHPGAFSVYLIPVCLAFLVLISCGPKAAVTPERESKSVTISLAAAWDNLNVITSGSDYKLYLLNLLFDKLVIIRDDSSIIPRLLSSWTTSPDGLTITGTIHERAAWHDGRPVTAEDVVFTVGLFANPAVPTSVRFTRLTGTDDTGLLIPGETLGVRAVDAKTVAFSLKEPIREIVFFSESQIFFVLPKHLLENSDPTSLLDNPFFQNPVGSGPYVFKSQIIGTEARFTANGNFHLGKPDIDELNIRIISNNNVLAGLLSGEVDVTGGTAISSLPYSDFQLAKQQNNLITVENPYLGVQFMILNTSNPVLRDLRVRRALEHAINKQRFVDDLYGGAARPAYSAISSLNNYYNRSLQYAEYNPEKARALLNEAGFDFNRPLTLIVPSGVSEREQSAVLIQQDFAAVGVKLEIEIMEFAALGSILMDPTKEFHLCLMGEATTANPSAFKGYYSGYNLARLQDTVIYDLYSEAERTLDDGKAQELYNRIQQLNSDTAPFIFLYSPNQLLAYNRRLSGIDFGSHFLIDNIWEWKVN
jgi:peptide/nickel transport system substrate-binding protein